MITTYEITRNSHKTTRQATPISERLGAAQKMAKYE